MTSGPLYRFARFIFATPLSRELTLALLIKMAALGLIGWLFFRDPGPPASVDEIGHHLLNSKAADLRCTPVFSQGEPHDIGNRR